MTRAVAVLAFLLVAAVGHCLAAGRAQCGQLPSMTLKRSVGYCALLPPSYDAQPNRRFPVLYLLHGLGSDHQSLVASGIWSIIEELQAEKSIGEFVVVTPQAWSSFYINSSDGRLRYEDFFIREFIPSVEKMFRAGGSAGRRAVSGISMGGYGALRFAFKYPQMFSSVSAHSAALIAELPKGTSIATETGNFPFLTAAFGRPVDAAHWKRNTPLSLASSARLQGVSIYFDCGDRDDFGFETGNQQLHEQLKRRKIPHEFHLRPGDHRWDYFARNLPASLQFHSREFGLTAKK